MITMFQPSVPERAVERVAACLRQGWISEGRVVREFEAAFAEAFALPNALAVNSGTAALHLALLGAGVASDDEVITTAQTFVATPMAVRYVGAIPVFADIVAGGPNIDPADIARRISERTRAIVVVHYGGYPCDMDEISSLAEQHGLAVIEDAAHALGATYKGRPVGALGDFGAFSFQAIKQLTTGDGGMLTCRDPSHHRHSRRRRWFGIDRDLRATSELGEPVWDISEVGYKYHMNDITATLGLSQLETFEASQSRRRQLNGLYRSSLAGLGGFDLLPELADRESSCWLFTARVERRLDFVRAMRARGVEAAVWHRRIDGNSVFGGLREDLPNQAAFDATQVSLPLRETLRTRKWRSFSRP